MESTIYYSGGFAELVSKPSRLTYSFLKDWFTGNGSLGGAMRLLGLPFAKRDQPVLDFRDDELLVNINSEEDTLYSPTVLSYEKTKKGSGLPRLKVSLKKILSPVKLINTGKLLVTQAKWIQDPQKLVNLSEKLVSLIPEESADDLPGEESVMKNDVWPSVIALGYVNEFYTQVLTQNLSDSRKIEVNQYVDSAASKEDWLFRSIADQYLVKEGQMSFSDYINEYGLRADDDYELTIPRWHEITDVIEKRIDSSSRAPVLQKTDEDIFNKKERSFLDTLAKLRVIRSLAKKRALFHINALRQALLVTTNGTKKFSSLTKTEIFSGEIVPVRPGAKKSKKKSSPKRHTVKGKGTPVSAGETWGMALHIDGETPDVPDNTIGIFPTAGPEYTTLFPKCKGIIFIKGSASSHGAIITREFGIPAIVDPGANPEDGYKLMLNANTGEWKIIG